MRINTAVFTDNKILGQTVYVIFKTDMIAMEAIIRGSYLCVKLGRDHPWSIINTDINRNT